MMAYAPRLVANAFLVDAKKRGVGLTHMQLQKLVFFIHAWSLALKRASFLNERPEAWKYGPVFESLYHELKAYGSQNVGNLLTEFNPSTGTFLAMVPSPQDQDFWSLFEQVRERYGRFSAMELSALSHEKGGPWEQARGAMVGDIPDDWIADFYRSKLNPGPGPATQ
jgi:uncharacterized phage-associated protein